jgi:aryl-alcohol dehydrogenase-like predicted oxidoreductase
MARFAPRRPLGRTGFVATRIGQGDLADRSQPAAALVATLRRALDAGVNVVDTAPSYEDGWSEEVVGAALAGRREGVLLVDKIDHLDRPVGPQLDGSLARLGLPAVDLLAFHSVSRLEDWERLAAPGGGLEEAGEEVARGRARFRGLSSHDPDVLAAALADGRCDVLLFPVGPFVHRRYVQEILPRARAAGVGTIGFKAFGAGKLLGDTEGYGRPLPPRPAQARPRDRMTVAECLSFVLTCDPDVALLGLSTPAEQDEAFAAAERFRPLAPEEMKEVRRRALAAVRGKGPAWWNPSAPAVPDG